jgi:hypothetical protein
MALLQQPTPPLNPTRRQRDTLSFWRVPGVACSGTGPTNAGTQQQNLLTGWHARAVSNSAAQRCTTQPQRASVSWCRCALLKLEQTNKPVWQRVAAAGAHGCRWLPQPPCCSLMLESHAVNLSSAHVRIVNSRNAKGAYQALIWPGPCHCWVAGAPLPAAPAELSVLLSCLAVCRGWWPCCCVGLQAPVLPPLPLLC